MCKWIVLFALFFGLILQASGFIKVKGITGTEFAQLGTNTTTIKCDYEYENETGVEVKWFYNDNEQIYTWVPNRNNPQPMGLFVHILDVNNNTIRFKQMTKNLTGSYTCKVTSFDNEASKTKFMIVYQPPKKVEFFPEETSETLICSAYELYPTPNITIIESRDSISKEVIPLSEENEVLTNTDDNFYNITKTLKFDSKAIKGSAKFICNVFIPDTSFNHTIILTYEKRGNIPSPADNPEELVTNSADTSIKIKSSNSAESNSTAKENLGVPSTKVSIWLVLLMSIGLRQ